MADKIEWHPNGTPGPWHVGAQNDMLYVIAGREPAQSNDYPWHEAPRVVVAKAFGPCVSDLLPVNERVNARAIAEVPAMVLANRATNAHLELMQAAVIEHLKPDGDLVDKNAFINRIIYLLDGPEQRALQDSIRAILASIDGEANNAPL